MELDWIVFAPSLMEYPLSFQSGSDSEGHPHLSRVDLELEQRLLETRLKQQQLQSDQDARWLHQKESDLKKRLSMTGSYGSDHSGPERSASQPDDDEVQYVNCPESGAAAATQDAVVVKVTFAPLFQRQLF